MQRGKFSHAATRALAIYQWRKVLAVKLVDRRIHDYDSFYDIAKLAQPTALNEKIYPTGDARAQIQQALTGASNRLIDVESLSEEELETLHRFYGELATLAKRDIKLSKSHSIEEARLRHAKKH